MAVTLQSIHDMRAIFFLTFLVRSTVAGQCASAFSLPLQDVLVAPNITNSYIMGIPATIGTPEQNIVFLPWAELNNTYVYDQNAFCDKTVIFSDTICLVRRGGFYLETASTAFDQKLGLIDAGGAPQETSNDGAEVGIKDLIHTSLSGIDKLNMALTGAIESFPIGIPRQPWDFGYSTLHPLGLGRNSTYLNTLYEAGKIPSRVWSIYWGRMWTQNNPLNGSVVLGGYDERKIIGDNFTRTLDYTGGCFTGMKVTITDVVLNFRSGQQASLLSANTAITACVVPTRQLLFQGPSGVLDAFQKQTSINSTGLSFGIHWGAMIFNANNVYDGDITFELESSLQVRVSNDQFVTPSVAYERNGSRVFNQSAREVVLGEVYPQVATLGRYFLTASYLMVDYEENTWTLWKSNPTSRSSLKSIFRRSPTCSDSVNGTTASLPPRNGVALSDGSIAGIVIGVVLGLLAILVLGMMYYKKMRLRQKDAQQAIVAPTNESKGPQELHGLSSLRHMPETKYQSMSTVAQLESNEARRTTPREMSHELSVATPIHEAYVSDRAPSQPFGGRW